MNIPEATGRRAIQRWLTANCLLIVAMVVVGGITRLTGSGLSIVEWKPIMGAIPPLTPEAWEAAFRRYQEYPQYRLLNAGMTLAQFKGIFFWEYAHRLLGRLIGAVFLLPWLYFLARGWLRGRLAWRLGFAFVLGGLQGALGWFMVQSGLVDRPSVSQYRLAAHLLLALVTLGYLFWMRLELGPAEARSGPAGFRGPLRALAALVFVQIFYGALTAGLKAGYVASTFPKMNGEWVPSGWLALEPGWLNFLANPRAVMFTHRLLGFLLVLGVSALWMHARRIGLHGRPRASLDLLLGLLILQFALGVATVLLVVPLAVASLHQLGACILFLAALGANHAWEGARPLSRVLPGPGGSLPPRGQPAP